MIYFLIYFALGLLTIKIYSMLDLLNNSMAPPRFFVFFLWPIFIFGLVVAILEEWLKKI